MFLPSFRGQGSNESATASCKVVPVSKFLATGRNKGGSQDLYTVQRTKGSFDEIFCLEFVSGVAHQLFANGLALKDIKDPRDLMTMPIPSACPKSFVSNDAMICPRKQTFQSAVGISAKGQ